MNTVTSLMKDWNKYLQKETDKNIEVDNDALDDAILHEAVSAFTVLPEYHHETEEKDPIRVKRSEMAGAASNAYGERRKSIDGLMTTTHKLMTALDKAQKKDSENWAHVQTAGDLENKLGDINQMLGGI